MNDAKAYMVVTCTIDATKREAFTHYVRNARPIFATYGGTPAGQYATAETVFGDSGTTHVIVLAFPSADAIRSVFADPAYQALVPARSEAFPKLDILIAGDFDPTSLIVA